MLDYRAEVFNHDCGGSNLSYGQGNRGCVCLHVGYECFSLKRNNHCCEGTQRKDYHNPGDESCTEQNADFTPEHCYPLISPEF